MNKAVADFNFDYWTLLT